VCSNQSKQQYSTPKHNSGHRVIADRNTIFG